MKAIVKIIGWVLAFTAGYNIYDFDPSVVGVMMFASGLSAGYYAFKN